MVKESASLIRTNNNARSRAEIQLMDDDVWKLLLINVG